MNPMMNLDFLFPTPIFYSNLDIDNSELYEFYKNYRKFNAQTSLYSNLGGWQSDKIDLEAYDEIKKFRDVAEKNVNSMLYEYGIDSEKARFKMFELWFGSNVDTDHNVDHVHGPSAILSGTYYVKVPQSLKDMYENVVSSTIDNAGPGTIVFSKNLQEVYYSSRLLQYTDNETTPITVTAAPYPPKEGMMLAFPSNLPHRVAPSFSDEERVSISFDFVLEHL